MKAEKQLARNLVELVSQNKGKELEEAIKEIVSFFASKNQLFRMRMALREFDNAWKEKFGAANIIVETAHELSKALKDDLEEYAKGASLKEKINKDLIGGAKIRVDDEIIDGSILGKIESLKTNLLKA
ncbi:MAG: F0F1 ATP synthase subunit delta [Patescibacteria group bacterium]